eukprot:m.139034 g.139034  ORF g.139034 m.139034 type:complete len:83 (+) comp9978_c0_seq3:933-1181(+)
MSMSSLTTIDPLSLSKVENYFSLVLEDAGITMIPEAMFFNQRNLKFLWLNKNKITSLSNETFRDTTSLRTMSVFEKSPHIAS